MVGNLATRPAANWQDVSTILVSRENRVKGRDPEMKTH